MMDRSSFTFSTVRRAAWGCVAAAAFVSVGSGVKANVSQSEMVAAGMPSGLAAFSAAVSASEGNWNSVNQIGCAGAFQFCPATRRQYYPGSRESFLASPSTQVSVYRRYMTDQWNLATRNNFVSLIGQQVCFEGQCRTITASSIIYGCQFGCATGGALGRYFRTGDCDQARDGNGVSVCRYLIRGAGYDVSGITGEFDAGPTPPGGVGTCFQNDLMSSAGLRATSPFGVDRTGRASAGYHLGLDLANNIGIGDPIMAGIEGTVVLSVANGTNSVFIESLDGRQRVGFLHGASRRVAQGNSVQPDTVVITQGDLGSPGAVHLHLEVHISGDVMASLGESAGRVWPLQNRTTFFGDKKSSGLSGASFGGATPPAFYVVNPETYLYSRVPFTPSVLNAQQYISQGFSRPDGLTLEPTCAPSADFVNGGGMASVNGGHNAMEGLIASGSALVANPQTLTNMASSDGRDAAIQYGQASIGASRSAMNYSNTMRGNISVMAGLILATED